MTATIQKDFYGFVVDDTGKVIGAVNRNGVQTPIGSIPDSVFSSLADIWMANGGHAAQHATLGMLYPRIPRESVIANRAALPSQNIFGTAKQFMSRTLFVKLEGSNYIKLMFDNFATNGNAEDVGSLAATVEAHIEYPVGTLSTLVTFSSATAGSIPAGGSLVSDAIALNIPRGGVFAVRTFLDAPGGAAYFLDGLNNGSGIETCAFGSSVSNVAHSLAAIANTTATLTYRPSAVLGMTGAPVAAIIGDSRNAGLNDKSDDVYGAVGETARSCSPSLATFNLASPGAKISGIISGSGYTRRLARLSQYCTHALSNFGINDIEAGVSAATCLTNLTTLCSLVGVPLYQSSIPPKTTSTDNWATTANQTLSANNTARIAYNNGLRSGAVPISGYAEVADIVESGRDSGKWKADGSTAYLYTGDGLHESQYGYRQIMNANPWSRVLSQIK